MAQEKPKRVRPHRLLELSYDLNFLAIYLPKN